jgi:chromosome partitioning protein
MVIGITNLKGGVGKSTLSQNLAVALSHKGYKVCILDTDMEQRSSMKWHGLREQKPDVPVFGVEGDQINKVADEQSKSYDIVIIDGSPQLSKTATKTLTASDIVLVPITPSSLDVWSFENFLERYEQVKAIKGDNIQAYIVLNRYTGTTKLDKEVLDVMGEFDVKLFDTTIGQRVAYREAPTNGLGVVEFRDPKAKEEMFRFTEEVEKVISAFIQN